MAYSSYGGMAYRNGVRVIERSDFVMGADGGKGYPGTYPGYAAIAEGMSPEEWMKKLNEHAIGHAVLGEFPLMLVLYKETNAYLFLSPDHAPRARSR